jgi:aminoglycoside/choline kinase family phosphotransferase
MYVEKRIENLGDPIFDNHAILKLYRVRWQVEISFKRMKSLMHRQSMYPNMMWRRHEPGFRPRSFLCY